ncbi:MAG TPA: terminase small subunit [Syntrophales bacterium]|nr:terminase small subunit [Syntrophales bacterium]
MAIRKNGDLTPKENLFVVEYLKDFNATQAAIRAGYSKKTARNIASENLTKPHIQTAIVNSRNSLKNLTDQALMEARELEQHLDALIRFNLKDFVHENGEPKSIHELTNGQAACIRELGIIETQIGTHRSLKFYDKIQAIKLKMQRLGLLKETVNMNATVETYEQCRKRLRLDDPDVQRMLNEED